MSMNEPEWLTVIRGRLTEGQQKALQSFGGYPSPNTRSTGALEPVYSYDPVSNANVIMLTVAVETIEELLLVNRVMEAASGLVNRSSICLRLDAGKLETPGGATEIICPTPWLLELKPPRSWSRVAQKFYYYFDWTEGEVGKLAGALNNQRAIRDGVIDFVIPKFNAHPLVWVTWMFSRQSAAS